MCVLAVFTQVRTRACPGAALPSVCCCRALHPFGKIGGCGAAAAALAVPWSHLCSPCAAPPPLHPSAAVPEGSAAARGDAVVSADAPQVRLPRVLLRAGSHGQPGGRQHRLRRLAALLSQAGRGAAAALLPGRRRGGRLRGRLRNGRPPAAGAHQPAQAVLAQKPAGHAVVLWCEPHHPRPGARRLLLCAVLGISRRAAGASTALPSACSWQADRPPAARHAPEAWACCQRGCVFCVPCRLCATSGAPASPLWSSSSTMVSPPWALHCGTAPQSRHRDLCCVRLPGRTPAPGMEVSLHCQQPAPHPRH